MFCVEALRFCVSALTTGLFTMAQNSFVYLCVFVCVYEL